MQQQLPMNAGGPKTAHTQHHVVLAFAGPLLLVALASARIAARSPSSPHAHVFVAQELVLLLGAAVLAAAACWTRLSLRRDPVNIAVCVLIALEIASVAFASDPWVALRSATVWIAGLIVFVIARALGPRARDLGLGALLLPLGLVAGSVILEALGVVRLSAARHAPGGLLGERNVAAEFLVVGAPVIAYTAIVDGPGWRRRVALGVSALATTAIVFGRTRSAWLAGLVLASVLSALAVAAFRPWPAAKRARHVLTAVIVGVLLALSLPATLRWRSAHPYRDTLVHLVDPGTSSGSGRLVQYGTTLRMAQAHPGLGVGPGNWAGQYLSFAQPGDRTIHEGFTPVNRLPNSDLFGFAAERGFLAILVLAALAITLFRQGGPAHEVRVLRRAVLVTLLIVASLDAVLQTPASLLLAAWVLGLTSPSAEAEQPIASTPSSSPSPLPVPALAFALLSALLLIAAIPAMRRVVSLDVASKARGSEDFDRAASLDPGDIGLRLVAAESWIGDDRCDRAQPHLDAVGRFSPASPARSELAARCSRVEGSR